MSMLRGSFGVYPAVSHCHSALKKRLLISMGRVMMVHVLHGTVVETVTDPFSDPFFACFVEHMSWNLVFGDGDHLQVISEEQVALNDMKKSIIFSRKHSSGLGKHVVTM